MPVFDLISLANSYKMRGRCLAGIRSDGGGWIRPVAETPFGELYPRHYRLGDGSAPQALDLVRVECDRHVPQPHQPENWLLVNTPWRLLSRPAPKEMAPVLRAQLAENPALLGSRTQRIPYEHLVQRPASSSLAVIAPETIHWRIDRTPYNRKQPRSLFALRGVHYDLPVTDPAWIPKLQQLEIGVHSQTAVGVSGAGRMLFSVSLTDPFEEDGCCYKLIAGVILLPESWAGAS